MGDVSLTWAGGEHDFKLTLDHLRAIQDRCDAGPEFVMRRLLSPQWLIDDVLVPIRLGLEGGGMAKEDARKLVRIHLEERPDKLKEGALVAHQILVAAILGNAEDMPGELKAGMESQIQTRSHAESGGSPISTPGQGSSIET
jgi:hypothetical protein